MRRAAAREEQRGDQPIALPGGRGGVALHNELGQARESAETLGAACGMHSVAGGGSAVRLAARVLRAPRRAPRAFACLQTVPQTEAVVGNVELRACKRPWIMHRSSGDARSKRACATVLGVLCCWYDEEGAHRGEVRQMSFDRAGWYQP